MSEPGPQAEPWVEPAQVSRFEPLPQPRWQTRALTGEPGQPATPERWFEQAAMRPDGPGGSAAAPAGSVGRSFFIRLLAVCLLSAAIGTAGTLGALGAAGTFNARSAAVGGGSGAASAVDESSSAVGAAVARAGSATVQIAAQDGTGNTAVGAGIIYDVRGWILTNRHVVSGAKTITIRLSDDRRVSGRVYGLDTLTDLAIVKMDNVIDVFAAPIGDSSSVQVGQPAIAIGSPLGLAYPNSVSEGIVSALGRDIAVASDGTGTAAGLHGLIQTDAALNPGNSGGPLIDSSGRVIGVTTASDVAAQGIGFAIPINIAKPIMQQALAGETLSRPFIGITYELLSRGLAAQYSLPLDHGAWVHKLDSSGGSIEAVTAGSPGSAAGIQTGDIVTSVEGQTVDQLHPLEELLVQYAPGRTISLQLFRNGSYQTVQVTLGTRPENAG